jgi:hypothetical protein
MSSCVNARPAQSRLRPLESLIIKGEDAGILFVHPSLQPYARYDSTLRAFRFTQTTLTSPGLQPASFRLAHPTRAALRFSSRESVNLETIPGKRLAAPEPESHRFANASLLCDKSFSAISNPLFSMTLSKHASGLLIVPDT